MLQTIPRGTYAYSCGIVGLVPPSPLLSIGITSVINNVLCGMWIEVTSVINNVLCGRGGKGSLDYLILKLQCSSLVVGQSPIRLMHHHGVQLVHPPVWLVGHPSLPIPLLSLRPPRLVSDTRSQPNYLRMQDLGQDMAGGFFCFNPGHKMA